MKVTDIPYSPEYFRKTFNMGDLLRRADTLGRTSWVDLPDVPGIYVVYWTTDTPPEFMDSTGKAIFATPANSTRLQTKWDKIQTVIPTDVIYLGKADNIRRRVRLLVRFGVGKANNHQGGEWMWQIQAITSARVLVQSCPSGKQLRLRTGFSTLFSQIMMTIHLRIARGRKVVNDGDHRYSDQVADLYFEDLIKVALLGRVSTIVHAR